MEGEAKMIKMLKKDITIKLISIFFAMLLWFVVMDNANPACTVEFSIPLKTEHEASLQQKGLSIKNNNLPKNVSVIVKGRKDKVSTINSNDIEASIDLSKIENIKTNVLNVGVYLNREGITLQGVSPMVISIEVEKIESNNFGVEIETLGTLKENYKIISKKVSPEKVLIYASDSIIKSIGKIVVSIDVNNLNKDLSIKKNCRVYDHTGTEITSLNQNIMVDVSLQVAKEVPIVPVLKGQPAKNFIDKAIKVAPEKVLITGDNEILNTISEIRTNLVDIENQTQNINKSSSINLPKGVKLIDSFDKVSVFIELEQLVNKDFMLSSNDIAIINTNENQKLKYKTLIEKTVVTLMGTSEKLEKINISSISPYIDVLDLKEGQYRLPLKFILPESVKITQTGEIDVVIEK